MKKTALYFGSFNPVHIGHLIIASYIIEYTDMDELIFVVSPQNPLKKKQSLLDDIHRLAMLKIAIDDNPKMQVSDVEFSMPKPSYTIDTLTYLGERYPEREFYLIMGEDNLEFLHKWKNADKLIEQYKILVYPRPHADGTAILSHPNIQMVNAPQIDISASFIRNAIKEKKDVRYMLHPRVYKYIDEMNFYK